jgi:hypothetical protein
VIKNASLDHIRLKLKHYVHRALPQAKPETLVQLIRMIDGFKTRTSRVLLQREDALPEVALAEPEPDLKARVLVAILQAERASAEELYVDELSVSDEPVTDVNVLELMGSVLPALRRRKCYKSMITLLEAYAAVKLMLRKKYGAQVVASYNEGFVSELDHGLGDEQLHISMKAELERVRSMIYSECCRRGVSSNHRCCVAANLTMREAKEVFEALNAGNSDYYGVAGISGRGRWFQCQNGRGDIYRRSTRSLYPSQAIRTSSRSVVARTSSATALNVVCP